MQNIQILDEIEHIRKRPGMYIGDGKDITHLLEELLDNALDEVTNGYASVVALVKNNNEYSVLDNGRGIPVYFNEQYQEDIPVLLFSKLFSGGKFNENNYKVKIGAHGVGLVVVNALSTKLLITIYHDTKDIISKLSDTFKVQNIDLELCKKNKLAKFTYLYNNGVLEEKKIEYTNESKPYSTCITFAPDAKYFQSITYDKKFIEHRLKIASIFTGATILWRENNNDILITETLDSYFTRLFQYNDKDYIPIIKHSSKNTKTLEGYDLIATWNINEVTSSVYSSINLLPVSDGVHINVINSIIQNVFEDLKDTKKYTFLKTDVTSGLKYYCNVYLIDPYMEGQTKEKLSNNSTNKQKIVDITQNLYSYLCGYFKDNKDIFTLLCDKFQAYRDSLSSKKTIRKLVGNTNIRGLSSKDSRLKDCTSLEVEKSELLICEGESAAGSLTQCRDYRYHAILPLKGKTINVVSNEIDKIISNKEILDIIKSVGVGIKLKPTDKLDLTKIRYGKIILVADSDPDGGHILSLLMAAFVKFTPEIVEEGYLYICLPPLYALRNKKEYLPFQTKDDMDLYISNKKLDISKYEVLRYKGLGEMNPEEMQLAAINKSTRKLVQLVHPTKEEIDHIFNLLISSDEKRILLNLKEVL